MQNVPSRGEIALFSGEMRRQKWRAGKTWRTDTDTPVRKHAFARIGNNENSDAEVKIVLTECDGVWKELIETF